jgi:non-specific serine/threonine protein kinase
VLTGGHVADEVRTRMLDNAVAVANAEASALAAAGSGRVATVATASSGNQLSPREREVAALLAQGLTNRSIAEQLVITEWTADSHVRHILSKLKLRSRAQVAAWAVEQGLARPPAP